VEVDDIPSDEDDVLGPKRSMSGDEGEKDAPGQLKRPNMSTFG
jgi:hypothetical protein